VHDASDDGKSILFYVEGPSNAPAYYVYSVDAKNIADLGSVRESLANKALPTASVFTWKSRDGLDLTGYLTRPAGAADARSLPLVVMPHGGPEARDLLTFDGEVQFFASRGYGVFQPNFRGSDGYGEAFARRGYGEWGRKMQDDVADGLKALIESGAADPNRVCIVGVSYGGYAALAGAALTPDLYRCAVSRAGVTDLAEFLQSRKRRFGADSDAYHYWLESIGDPETDAAKLAAASPARMADRIRIPVLLLHGTDDEIVPYEQSDLMKKALDKAGHPTELLRFEGEDHSNWSTHNQKAWLIAVDRFLWQQLGPGYGVTTPPEKMPELRAKKR
jgi:dipeptidyl aminopeptidase/acylaminoacyl peptidase